MPEPPTSPLTSKKWRALAPVAWWALGSMLVACSHLSDGSQLGVAGNPAAAGRAVTTFGQAGTTARSGSAGTAQGNRGGTLSGGAAAFNSRAGTSAAGAGSNRAGAGNVGVATGGSAARGGIAGFGGANAQSGTGVSTSGAGSVQGGAGKATVATGGSAAGGGAPNGGSSAGAAATTVGGSPAGGARTGGAGTAAGRTQSGGAVGATGGSSHTGVWNVMMLGDSITGFTCYPQLLAQQFTAGSHTNFALVGTVQNNQSCSGAPIVMTEGHGGYSVTYLPEDSAREACIRTTGCGSYAELQTWAATKPDIVLMHYGTNDVWDAQPTASIVSAYVSIMSEFRKQNPNVIFFVSKLIKLDPTGCADCLTNVADLAANVTASWASANSTATSPVFIIDHYNCGFDPATDSSDGVHPTPIGAAKMATASFNAVVAKGYF
jgi:acyl-CoA thioesterase-1